VSREPVKLSHDSEASSEKFEGGALAVSRPHSRPLENSSLRQVTAPDSQADGFVRHSEAKQPDFLVMSMTALAGNQISFCLHGPASEIERISGTIFALKLHALVSALKAADAAVNGRRIHDYFVTTEHSDTPTAILSEETEKPQRIYGANSGISAFKSCAEAIIEGDFDRAREFGATVNRIAKLAAGAATKAFSYAEVKIASADGLRVDDFLKSRAARVLEPSPLQSIVGPSKRWFHGSVFGTFDGKIRAVELRGSLPEITLCLTAGGAEINCICTDKLRQQIGAAVSADSRVTVSGKAIYDESQPLPLRIVVSQIKLVRDHGDFTKWSGAFEPFEVETWPEDDE
jgi:hypothetical protein